MILLTPVNKLNDDFALERQRKYNVQVQVIEREANRAITLEFPDPEVS